MSNPTNCVLFLSFFLSFLFSLSSPSIHIFSILLPPYRHWRAELNNLQANVEFLTSRIDSAAFAAKPADSYQYESTTTNDVIDPIISSTHSSPQNSNANFTQPESTVDDNANYAITPSVLDTPSKTLKRSTSIKYVNDVDDEPVYYNETPTTSYVEQPAAYFEPAPGNPQAWIHFLRHILDQIKIQHLHNRKLFITSFLMPHIHIQKNDKINKNFSFSFRFHFFLFHLEQALDI